MATFATPSPKAIAVWCAASRNACAVAARNVSIGRVSVGFVHGATALQSLQACKVVFACFAPASPRCDTRSSSSLTSQAKPSGVWHCCTTARGRPLSRCHRGASLCRLDPQVRASGCEGLFQAVVAVQRAFRDGVGFKGLGLRAAQFDAPCALQALTRCGVWGANGASVHAALRENAHTQLGSGDGG